MSNVREAIKTDLRELIRRQHAEIGRLKADNERLREALGLAERLAAGRLAMVEQLTGDVDALRRDAERYKWVLGWLVRSGLLSCEACRIDTPESYGNWWILRKPRSIDGGSFVAYGADLRDAIDAAMGDKT